MSEPKFVWLDLETTGLDHNTNHVLEIAAIVTDVIGTPIASKESVIAYRLPIDFETSPVVQKMHTENRLWDACAEAGAPLLPDVQEDFINFLISAGCKPGAIHLAGNSVHFDYRFLLVHMPELAKFFHYRILDMTSVQLWAASLSYPPPPKASPHRALPDAQGSLNSFHYYRDLFKAGR